MSPEQSGLAETPHWTSDDALDLDFLPESVIVLGAGAGTVACELAQCLNRGGMRVIQKVPWHHPTLSEIRGNPLEDLADQCRRPVGVAIATRACPAGGCGHLPIGSTCREWPGVV